MGSPLTDPCAELGAAAVKDLQDVVMKGGFPNNEDFMGAAHALIRLQDTYELNITELSRGKLWDRQTHAGNFN